MVLRFKLDENLPSAVKSLLVEQGHDALTALDQDLGGHPDDEVASVCNAENRILITFDLDFSDIRQYPPDGHPGLWILRPVTQSVDNTIKLVRVALSLIDFEPTEHALWIVELSKVRIRTSRDV